MLMTSYHMFNQQQIIEYIEIRNQHKTEKMLNGKKT